ncbi:phage tail protein [Yersinia bercovieri]|uniref:phage tail protein n=1 Tax=Yersinia bercovieri TaxID=634 RepID=UPI0021BD90AF|nr:phage tail protein [Yersinia bercovieri]
MTTKFFAILTNLGAAKLANATALGTQLQITHMAVGDGGGVLPLPNAAQTQLIGEKRRAALNSLSVDAANSSQIIAEQVIPETDGGWWIREIGLFDKDGVLIAIANCPETYKPQLQEGSGRTQTVRMVLIVSSTEAVTLKIDPSVVLATRKYVDDKVIEVRQYADKLLSEHEKSRNHPDASLTAKGFVKLSSATTSDSEVLAATPKAVKTVADNAAKALGDHGKEANPHDQYFQIANLLSEIKALGPDALAEVFKNLELGDAAKKGIASNTEMQVGTADKLVSLPGLMTLFGELELGVNDWVRIPDRPGGTIFQVFEKQAPFGAGTWAYDVPLPIAFPNACLHVFVGISATGVPMTASTTCNIKSNAVATVYLQSSTGGQQIHGHYLAIGN